MNIQASSAWDLTEALTTQGRVAYRIFPRGGKLSKMSFHKQARYTKQEGPGQATHKTLFCSMPIVVLLILKIFGEGGGGNSG